MKQYSIKTLLLVALALGVAALLVFAGKIDGAKFQEISTVVVAVVMSIFALGYIFHDSGFGAAFKSALGTLYGARKLFLTAIFGLACVVLFVTVDRFDANTFALLFFGIFTAGIGGNVVSKFAPSIERLAGRRQEER